MRAVKLLLATAFVAVGGFAATATLTDAPEEAHAAPRPCNYIQYHPSDSAWVCADSPGGFYWACDYDVDGHRVRAWIDTTEPSPGDGPDRMSAWAPSQGCSEPEGVAYGGIHILRIRICTQEEGCSAWKRVT
jgi:hypothetical protein